MINICLLAALKVMILAFTKQMTSHWPKLSKIVRDLMNKRVGGGAAFYSFIDFVVSVNQPITLMIVPIAHHKVSGYFCTVFNIDYITKW
jgi:hypothetical protein